jgi:hypothetical protein
MSGSHTPGPWHRNIRAGGKYPTVFYGDHYSEIKHVAHIARNDPDEMEANIDLICAAPELLAALEELVLAPNKIRPEKYWEAARAAIAKAKGQKT